MNDLDQLKILTETANTAGKAAEAITEEARAYVNSVAVELSKHAAALIAAHIQADTAAGKATCFAITSNGGIASDRSTAAHAAAQKAQAAAAKAFAEAEVVRVLAGVMNIAQKGNES